MTGYYANIPGEYMISKFSVKRPMTVFVAVVLVIVLGVVAFSKMTPDLLPNMDFPYIVIMTPYAGQTPETVEMSVSKPLEQSMSVIDGVKQITSNSSENYSTLMIQFEDGTNMDTATIDVRSALDTVSDKWDDKIGAPYLLKINPSILPVAMAAVDYEGKDRAEISRFVSDELMNRIEGIDGVASVSNQGILTEKEKVVISQKKLDKLNKKISAALDDQFSDAEDKLKDAQEELDKSISDAESGSAVISSSLDEINEQQEALATQLSEAGGDARDGNNQIISAKMELLDQKSSLTSTKTQLETVYQVLLNLQTTSEELEEERDRLEKALPVLKDAGESYNKILESLDDPGLTEEERAELSRQTDEINKLLEPYGASVDNIEEAILAVNDSLVTVDKAIDDLEKNLSSYGVSLDSLDDTLSEMTKQISTIEGGITEIDKAITGLDDKSVTVNDALTTVSKQQSSADFKLSSTVSTLTAKQTQLESAQTQLDSAKSELDQSFDTLKDQKKSAKEKADLKSKVTIENISTILTAQSFSMPAGYVEDDKNNRFMVRVGDTVKSEKELENLALFDTKIDGIGVIRLKDVADIFVADNSENIYAKINNRDGVILSFTKASNIATSTVCDNINSEFKALEEQYKGLEFTYLYSQGDYIHIIINGVLQNLLMGAALAIIILFLFLRDIKPTLIVACSIPISVVFAIVLMYFSGVTLNLISLSGLAIGVGMLVDNSVVVIENIYRLRSLGHSAAAAAVNGAKQVAGAIAASTLTTICVFVPIVFVEGITRQLFVDMALTIAYSLLASLVVALTLVPAMSRGMLRRIRDRKSSGEGRIARAYGRSLRFVLRHKVISIAVVIVLLLGSGFGALIRGFSFMPSMSGTEIQVDVSLDPNVTFEDTVAVGEQVNRVMSKIDEFETVGVLAGSSTSLMGLGSGSSSTGSLMAYGVLRSDSTKKGEEITRKLEKELAFVDGEVTVGGSTTSSMSTLIGESNVQVALYGDDLDVLRSTAKEISGKLEKLDCIEKSDPGLGATSPEIRVTVDKKKAAENSLTVAQVFQQVASAVSSEKTSATLKGEDGKALDIVVVKDNSQKTTADKLKNIKLTYTDAQGEEKSVKLGKIANIKRAETSDLIKRRDQNRFLTITAVPKEGHTLTEASNAADAALRDLKLPAGCSIEFEGSNEETMEAVRQLLLMMLLGVIMIYLIMVAQFQSLKSPFIIMFTIPLAFTGGFIGLLITGFDVSVISLIGFIMLCGIIVNNGIVLVDYINKLRIEGLSRTEAIVEAGQTRMRPILITALTTVLGLSVMALGIGTGAEMMQPLAVVCIGGLLYATFMTLYIIPLIYDAFNKKEIKELSDEELEIVED